MQRTLVLTILAGLLAGLVLAGCSRTAESPDDDLGTVGSFTLTECHGRTVRAEDLKGKVWVVAFFFTCCNEACPIVTKNMRQLQQEWRHLPDVVLVSITVDPSDDTPERLQQYASAFEADSQRWLFLTGDRDRIYALLRDSFHDYAGENPDPNRTAGNKVVHPNRLFLVDRQGRFRGYFEATKEEDLAKLRQKVRIMTSRMPAVNASLNGLAGVLMVAGFLAIRRRRVGLHKALMLATLGVSAVFLASYLYFHILICAGEPTRFQGQGWIRPVYLLILLSHTVLAAVVAPLALFTAYLGLRNRLGTHVLIGRITLPVWLYVSLTGVLVYFLLYHLYPAW